MKRSLEQGSASGSGHLPSLGGLVGTLLWRYPADKEEAPLFHPLAILLLTLLASPAETTSPAPDVPNIVYILADDLGYGELGCYGQEKIRTPNLDRLCAEGMRFTRHYSGSPVCAPSRCVLLTGMHTGHAIVRNNWENGGWGEKEPEGQYPMPAGTRTVSGLLQKMGYQTACVGKWGLGGPGTSGHPNSQGFDFFYGYLCQRKAHNYYPAHLWRNTEKDVLAGNGWYRAHQKIQEPLADEEEYYRRYLRETYAPERMLEETLHFIDDNRDHPFFLYYASPIPHVALQVPQTFVEQYPREWDGTPYLGQQAYLPHPRPNAAYAAMITHLDSEVGAILDKLEEHGLAENTLVLFSSDNGPTYAGGVDARFFNSDAGLNGLKGSVLEGGVRVPFIVRWPGHIEAGSTSNQPSGFQDLLPTLAEIVGFEVPGPTDGMSLLAALTGGENTPRPTDLYWELGDRQGIIHGDWKLVRLRLGKKNATTALYDLGEDPLETHDLAKERPEILTMMLERAAKARVPSPVFSQPVLDGSAFDQ